jgi:glyoxalase family protein
MTAGPLDGLVKGLHHITLVTSNQEANRRFYTEVLGLRRVKLSVNQDDVFHRHLFYADERGTTGSAITFFEWPELPAGTSGLGSPHHLSYRVPRLDAIPAWASWLRAAGVQVVGPLARDGRVSLYLRDMDGVLIELAAVNDEHLSPSDIIELGRATPTVSSITSDIKLSTFDHASPLTSDPQLAVRFFEKFLGLRGGYSVPDPDQGDATVMAIGNSEQTDFLRYLAHSGAREGFVGTGSVHHIAMAVDDERDQIKVMRHLDEVGVQNSGIIDRLWFRSLYFRDPDGNLLEVATKGPGYTADESQDSLGSALVLPRWIEPRRKEIEAHLKKTDASNPARWPPVYPKTPEKPEALTQPQQQ